MVAGVSTFLPGFCCFSSSMPKSCVQKKSKYYRDFLKLPQSQIKRLFICTKSRSTTNLISFWIDRFFSKQLCVSYIIRLELGLLEFFNDQFGCKQILVKQFNCFLLIIYFKLVVSNINTAFGNPLQLEEGFQRLYLSSRSLNGKRNYITYQHGDHITLLHWTLYLFGFSVFLFSFFF